MIYFSFSEKWLAYHLWITCSLDLRLMTLSLEAFPPHNSVETMASLFCTIELCSSGSCARHSKGGCFMDILCCYLDSIWSLWISISSSGVIRFPPAKWVYWFPRVMENRMVWTAVHSNLPLLLFSFTALFAVSFILWTSIHPVLCCLRNSYWLLFIHG